MIDKLVEALEKLAFKEGFDTNRVNLDDDPTPDRLYVITNTWVPVGDGDMGYWTAVIDLDIEIDPAADIGALAEQMYSAAMSKRPADDPSLAVM